MGALEIGSSAFEDPEAAPLPASTPSESFSASGDESQSPQRTASRSIKRKLPYRAELAVEGQRYKGRRVSRGDAALDVETLGLADQVRLAQEASDSEGDDNLVASSSEDRGLGSDVNFDGSSCESDDKENAKTFGLDEEENERQRRLEEEERAVAFRLAEAEKRELTRARAVWKQKDLYDATVDLRIRIEPLVALARKFPAREERVASAAWEPREELDEARQGAWTALEALYDKVDEAWKASCPLGHAAADVEFEKWRDAVLDRWGTKVNEAEGVVPKGGFKTFDTAPSAQVKASIATGKHMNRARRVRVPFELVGCDTEMPQGGSDLHYDDGEFYRTLLREIIESGEGAGGGLRYAQLSKSGKIAKKRDRSFAKGRRLKYDVHEKLVGFLAPVPLPDPGPLDEIVAAMFGRRGTIVSAE